MGTGFLDVLSGRAVALGKETGMSEKDVQVIVGSGRVRLAPTPLDEESRIRLAVDGWSELSEMPGELAWLIGYIVATDDLENSFECGVSRFWPPAERGGREAPLPAGEDWFLELAKKDRLLAWKMAVYGRTVDDRLLAAGSSAEGRGLSRRAQREIEGWSEVDEIPGRVAG